MQKTILSAAVLAMVALGFPASAYDYSSCNYDVIAVGALYLVDDHTADKDSGSVEWVYVESNGVEDLQRGATHVANDAGSQTGLFAWYDSCINHGPEGPDTVLY